VIGYHSGQYPRKEHRVEREPQTARERAVLLLRATLPGWRLTASQGLVWAIRGTIVLVVLVLIGSAVTSAVDKTLWAWLNLLIIPVVLAIGGYLFTHSQNRATQAAAERRAQDDALQSYLNQMGQLLLDKDTQLLHPKEGDDARTLARAWTLTVLPRLDELRKRSVVQFLYESGLITKNRAVIDLAGAHLARVNLTSANLRYADLSGAYLAMANLTDAKLSEADLGDAMLFGANLSLAKLDGANLSAAVLIGDKRSTPLQRISVTRTYTLGGAGPKNADLTYADMSGANLTDAYVSEEQLDSAESLKGVTMPNGRKYEEWLKSKGRGEDGENSTP
jgi:hypothetical protein